MYWIIVCPVRASILSACWACSRPGGGWAPVSSPPSLRSASAPCCATSRRSAVRPPALRYRGPAWRVRADGRLGQRPGQVPGAPVAAGGVQRARIRLSPRGRRFAALLDGRGLRIRRQAAPVPGRSDWAEGWVRIYRRRPRSSTCSPWARRSRLCTRRTAGADGPGRRPDRGPARRGHRRNRRRWPSRGHRRNRAYGRNRAHGRNRDTGAESAAAKPYFPRDELTSLFTRENVTTVGM